MNIPNFLTLLRILLVPVIVILLIQGHQFQAFGDVFRDFAGDIRVNNVQVFEVR